MRTFFTGSGPGGGLRRLAAVVVDLLPVPVAAAEGTRIARPRVLDHERRHDVLLVLSVPLLPGPVEVGLGRLRDLVRALLAVEVTDLDGVLLSPSSSCAVTAGTAESDPTTTATPTTPMRRRLDHARRGGAEDICRG